MIDKTTAIDLTLMAPIVDRYLGRQRDGLLPMLHEAQALHGWLSPEIQSIIGETLRVPLADVHGVIEFYTMFYNRPTARRVIRLCEDPACHLAGARQVLGALEHTLGIKAGETKVDHSVSLELVPCLGMCEMAPAALNGDRPAAHLSPEDVESFINGEFLEPRAKAYGAPKIVLGKVGVVDPASLDDYELHGGYRGLRKALSMSPRDLIDTAVNSGILGRGGAMFPLGRKWRFTRTTKTGVKHIVVNADESEPGTFKDRCILEEDPFGVVEAATLAAYAVGANRGWIFLRGEYPRAAARIRQAVKQARNAGYLGEKILDKDGFSFDIEVRVGAGAYICGEETALFEAIEGKRGFPRLRPPFPTTSGLFNQPTAINNVETLVTALAAINIGLEEWGRYGTEQSPGTKLFCVSGNISKPGVYEMPFGLSVRDLIEFAGGVPGEKAIQAVLMGGAAGVFIGPEQLDMKLSYEDARANEIPLGSGVIMVFDEDVDLRETFYQIGRFFAHESCGKCFPCQLGTQRQVEILDRIANGRGGTPSDTHALTDIGFVMTETSLCGLGQTAASAVLSAANLWPELFE